MEGREKLSVRNKSKSKSKKAGFLMFFLPFLLAGIFLYVMNDYDIGQEIASSLRTEKEPKLSTNVLDYEEEVRSYAAKEGIEPYTEVILAVMMQESGGRGNDPMQASESLCGEVGCITEPKRSIEQGVSYFGDVLERADYDVKLALQSYNFGPGFIEFVMERGGEYTQELAIEFSAQKYDELRDTGIYSCIREEAEQYGACYGDIYYVDAVLGYVEESDYKAVTNM